MSLADDTVVRREIVVAAPIGHAFETFTQRFGDFKPPEHNLLASPGKASVRASPMMPAGPCTWLGSRTCWPRSTDGDDHVNVAGTGLA